MRDNTTGRPGSNPNQHPIRLRSNPNPHPIRLRSSSSTRSRGRNGEYQARQGQHYAQQNTRSEPTSIQGQRQAQPSTRKGSTSRRAEVNVDERRQDTNPTTQNYQHADDRQLFS